MTPKIKHTPEDTTEATPMGIGINCILATYVQLQKCVLARHFCCYHKQSGEIKINGLEDFEWLNNFVETVNYRLK